MQSYRKTVKLECLKPQNKNNSIPYFCDTLFSGESVNFLPIFRIVAEIRNKFAKSALYTIYFHVEENCHVSFFIMVLPLKCNIILFKLMATLVTFNLNRSYTM